MRMLSCCKNKNLCSCCSCKGKKNNQNEDKIHAKDKHAKKFNCFNCCKKNKEDKSTGCFSCCKRKKNREETKVTFKNEKRSLISRLNCCGGNKIGDKSGFSLKKKRKNSWVDRKHSIVIEEPPKQKKTCKDILKLIFCMKNGCCSCCRKKPIHDSQLSRTTSIMSKKKSLTPTSVPQEVSNCK